MAVAAKPGGPEVNFTTDFDSLQSYMTEVLFISPTWLLVFQKSRLSAVCTVFLW